MMFRKREAEQSDAAEEEEEELISRKQIKQQ